MAVYQHEDDIPKQSGPGQVSANILGAAHGCVKGFCMGVAVYDTTEYATPGVHDDQEGFFVVSGEGMARVGDDEFAVRPGLYFVAAKGVPHAIKTTGNEPVKVIYAHGAV